MALSTHSRHCIRNSWLSVVVEKCHYTHFWQVTIDNILFSIFQNKSATAKTPDSRGKRTPPAKKATPQGPSPNKKSPSAGKSKSGSVSETSVASRSSSEVKKSLACDQTKTASPGSHSTPENDGNSLLWVDKYRPRSLKSLIGQQGDQSCANKLLRWLQNWHRHHSGNAKAPRQYKIISSLFIMFIWQWICLAWHCYSVDAVLFKADISWLVTVCSRLKSYCTKTSK